jgi:hypothetical protein
MLPPRAIVDASVLYSRHLRNALVWHSLEDLFELRWSALILDETRRSLIERNLDTYGEERAPAVDRVLERITSALGSAAMGLQSTLGLRVRGEDDRLPRRSSPAQ